MQPGSLASFAKSVADCRCYTCLFNSQQEFSVSRLFRTSALIALLVFSPTQAQEGLSASRPDASNATHPDKAFHSEAPERSSENGLLTFLSGLALIGLIARRRCASLR